MASIILQVVLTKPDTSTEVKYWNDIFFPASPPNLIQKPDKESFILSSAVCRKKPNRCDHPSDSRFTRGLCNRFLRITIATTIFMPSLSLKNTSSEFYPFEERILKYSIFLRFINLFLLLSGISLDGLV